MPPKVFAHRAAHKPQPKGLDNCQSPPYAVLPLLPYLPKHWRIWEPALGEGYMAQAFRNHGYDVITSSLDDSQDFFFYDPPEHYDAIITNPPWSLSAQWARRCFEIGKPFALLLKSDKIQDVGFQKLCREFGDFEQVHPDSRIDYKMPFKGWAMGAPINTHWYTWGLNIGKPHDYLAPIKKEKNAFKNELRRLAEIEAGQGELC